MPNSTRPTDNSILADYTSLPPFTKTVLQLCSVIYEPVDLSSLLRCLYKCQIPNDPLTQDYPKEVKVSIELLQRKHLLTNSKQCHPSVVEIISRQTVADNTFAAMAKVVQAELPSGGKSVLSGKTPISRAIRDLRLDLYTNNIAQFHKHLIAFYQGPHTIRQHPIVTICNNPFSAEWMDTQPDHLQFLAIHEILKEAVDQLHPIDDILTYLLKGYKTGKEAPILRHQSFLYIYISSSLMQGKFSEVKQLLSAYPEDSSGLTGWLDFLSGQSSDAIQSFTTDLQRQREISKDNATFFPGFEGVLYFMAKLQTEGALAYAELKQITNHIKVHQPDNQFIMPYTILQAVLECQKNNSEELSLDSSLYDFEEISSLSCIFLALASVWIEGRVAPGLQTALRDRHEKAVKNGYKWLAQEFAELISKITNDSQFQELADISQAQTATVPLLSAIKHEEPWQKAIKKLKVISERHGQNQSPTSRLIWLLEIDPASNTICEIHAREQKISPSGVWSKGRSLSTKRLSAPHRISLLTEQDKKICAAIRNSKDAYKGTKYYFDMEQAIWDMVEHPLIFRYDNPGLQVDIQKQEPELHVNDNGQYVAIYFSPFPGENDILPYLESKVRLTVYRITSTHRRIAEIVGKFGLQIPTHEKEQVLQLIGGIAVHLNIHSDFCGSSPKLKNIPPCPKIYCRILPTGSQFLVTLQVKPFEHSGPYLSPGRGSSVIISEIQGQMLQTNRDRGQEEADARRIEEACPTLMNFYEKEWEYLLPGLEECLNLLLELQPISNLAVIEWPKGESLKITHTARPGQLYIKIRKNHNWFDLNGTIEVDEENVLNMQQLLQMVRQSGSRFVPLSGGQFLALTKDLHKCLDELSSISKFEDNKIQVSHLAAPFLNNLTDKIKHLDADKHWQDIERKIRESDTLRPMVPSTLQTELRNYQKDGFIWLSRLAFMGVGACLADEMGLGKTVQALAAVLDQAPLGPSLVIAPTSVCPNWIDEALKFCPTLNIVTLGINDRQKTVRKLKKMDVLVTSYGLLQHENDLLAEKQWQIIILDEAQAIKNMTTKRSKAAMALKGKFKLITTGTPIENNLGELWNLFNFINPDLLGTISQFNRRYAAPIEKDKQRHAQKRLKNIISPFILRRLKSQVLEELPPRTEVNLHIELNDEEQALYESLRRNALSNLEENKAGNKQIRILAEIMRLRRVCCNPSLVAPELNITSSKLTLFKNVVSDLLTNRHKILVFSQFVDHLSIIRNFLDSEQISYQYLDGSTPARQRKKRVDDFQAGNGDIFLISLKAGGLGLNLTAANYVIHMDPWWNPAVEDQASDRAHRIGQKLPVTIYRMITKGTIEEKIVTLHQEKRELADSLLKGTDISKKVTADELLRLLRDE